MAKSRSNPTVGMIEGTVGGLVYYNWKGEPCVRRAPVREGSFTPAEQENQSRFAEASSFAKRVLSDPIQRARYEAAAKGTRLSAQNVAVSDFMHAPVLAEIDLCRYSGRALDFIRIRVEEGRIGAAAVQVSIADRNKTVLEAGRAFVELDGVSWWYAAEKELAPDQALWITVTASDAPGNQTSKTLRHTTGA